MSYLFSDNQEVRNDSGNPLSVRSVGASIDAFGRLRTSSPLTLFDSFHRFVDNGKISSAVSTSGATMSHNANASTIECTLDTSSGAYVKRESSRVFSYQPGKSLLILESFALAATKQNLRQRYGYFNALNGIFLEQTQPSSTPEIGFVRRSSSSGVTVDTKVLQSSWNGDKLDGTGASGKTLDLSCAQIMFIDIEWLGVGSVRCGFIIDGQFIIAHTFHHANYVHSTYMTTACLPIRAEIENTGVTASSSTMSIICASVQSEGGYELRGRPRSVGQAVNTAVTLSTATTYYPVISIRLRSDRQDAIVIPVNFDLIGLDASTYKWKVISGATISGGSWITPADSSIEYNLTGTSLSGGTDYKSGIFVATNTSSPTIQLDGDIFKYQLERNSFTSNCFTFTLAVAGKSNNDRVQATLDYEEIT